MLRPRGRLEATTRGQRLGLLGALAVVGYVAYANDFGGLKTGGRRFADSDSAHIVTELRCPPKMSRFVDVEKLADRTASLVREAKATRSLCAGRPRTVVTLSSFYGRHASLPIVVGSLLAQSCAPDKIYVFLSLVPLIDREFRHNKSRTVGDEIGAFEAELRGLSDLVDLRMITRAEDDFGPATKLLPALRLETDPATHLITVDDDTTYHEDTILALSLAARSIGAGVASSVGFWCEEFGWAPSAGYFFMHAQYRRECLGVSVEGTCHGWLSGVSGVLFERGALSDAVFNYSGRPRGCFLHDDVWFGGHVVSNPRAAPYLIDPGFKSRRVRRIEHDRSKSSSYLQTLKLREHGTDPEAQCASSFDYMREAVHRTSHRGSTVH